MFLSSLGVSAVPRPSMPVSRLSRPLHKRPALPAAPPPPAVPPPSRRPELSPSVPLRSEAGFQFQGAGGERFRFNTSCAAAPPMCASAPPLPRHPAPSAAAASRYLTQFLSIDIQTFNAELRQISFICPENNLYLRNLNDQYT